MSAGFFVLPWLAVCVCFDLDSRQLPAGLTVWPLALGVAWAGLTGNVAVGLLAVSILFSENVPPRWRLPYGLLQIGLAALAFREQGPDGLLLAGSLLGIWLAWRLGAFGGADAQALIVVALFLGLGPLLPIALATGLQGLVGLLRKQTDIPATLGIFAGTAAALLLTH